MLGTVYHKPDYRIFTLLQFRFSEGGFMRLLNEGFSLARMGFFLATAEI